MGCQTPPLCGRTLLERVYRQTIEPRGRAFVAGRRSIPSNGCSCRSRGCREGRRLGRRQRRKGRNFRTIVDFQRFQTRLVLQDGCSRAWILQRQASRRQGRKEGKVRGRRQRRGSHKRRHQRSQGREEGKSRENREGREGTSQRREKRESTTRGQGGKVRSVEEVIARLILACLPRWLPGLCV